MMMFCFSNVAAEYSEQFVCSVVLGDDVVSHLGLQSLLGFKQRLFQIIRDCDVPKVCDAHFYLINEMFEAKSHFLLEQTSVISHSALLNSVHITRLFARPENYINKCISRKNVNM